jgi:hypothetical protein
MMADDRGFFAAHTRAADAPAPIRCRRCGGPPEIVEASQHGFSGLCRRCARFLGMGTVSIPPPSPTLAGTSPGSSPVAVGVDPGELERLRAIELAALRLAGRVYRFLDWWYDGPEYNDPDFRGCVDALCEDYRRFEAQPTDPDLPRLLLIAEAAKGLGAQLDAAQWRGAVDNPFGGTWAACPACRGLKPGEIRPGVYDFYRIGHSEDCRLAAALAAYRKAKGGGDA